MILKKQKSKILAFSIIELLIIIILIGILVSIIVPRIATRTELARQKSALGDLEAIANAQERAGVDTGYIYRLYVLNDVSGGDGIGFGSVGDIRDGIRDEFDTGGGAYNTMYTNPRQVFIDVNTGNLLTPAQATTLFDQIRTNETAFNWQGPYLVVQRDRGSLPWQYSPTKGDDIPDDPWGNNYLFFTEKGLVQENQGNIVTSITFPGDGRTYNCKLYDRPTLLSLGKNGLPGDGTGPSIDPTAPGNFGQGDDIMRQF